MVDIHRSRLDDSAVVAWWQSTMHTDRVPTDPERVPKDRRLDRHRKPGRLIRPDPPDLWDRLGALVGIRHRSEVISKLIAHYLDGTPLPKRPDA
jgi:hypothetical protein